LPRITLHQVQRRVIVDAESVGDLGEQGVCGEEEKGTQLFSLDAVTGSGYLRGNGDSLRIFLISIVLRWESGTLLIPKVN
jgi:hypothetical protein